MTLGRQHALILTIQADLRKQEAKYLEEGCRLSAQYCKGQAEKLDHVLATLRNVEVLMEALMLLSDRSLLPMPRKDVP